MAIFQDYMDIFHFSTPHDQSLAGGQTGEDKA